MTVPPTTGAGPAPVDSAGPASAGAVKELLRISGTADDAIITAAVDAANAYVARLPNATVGDPPTWPADVVYGANLLAARAYRRRLSPSGVESFSDMAGAVYVSRTDPDVAMFLGIGAYAKPIVQ